MASGDLALPLIKQAGMNLVIPEGDISVCQLKKDSIPEMGEGFVYIIGAHIKDGDKDRWYAVALSANVSEEKASWLHEKIGRGIMKFFGHDEAAVENEEPAEADEEFKMMPNGIIAIHGQAALNCLMNLNIKIPEGDAVACKIKMWPSSGMAESEHYIVVTRIRPKEGGEAVTHIAVFPPHLGEATADDYLKRVSATISEKGFAPLAAVVNQPGKPRVEFPAGEFGNN
jgi:hypothetical protein